jgi:hypothetical protein
MWAIDYPFQPSAPAVAFLESAPLTDAERAQITHRNAERIFRIDRLAGSDVRAPRLGRADEGVGLEERAVSQAHEDGHVYR